MILANYHTHTVRCHHATGTEREYIENAIAAGVKILGFSDHSPYVFHKEGYYSGHRMAIDALGDYVQTLQSLREEYKDRIDIRIGLEAEYYPDLFADFLDLISGYEVEYLLLGQHFLGNEIGAPASGRGTTDVEILKQYVRQTIEAMETGKFTYFCHPDLIAYLGDDSVYKAEIQPLLDCAKALNVPLEINFLGIRDHRFYPHQLFWELAGKTGNTVIYGCDAHQPDKIPDDPSFLVAEEMVKKYNLHHIDYVDLNHP